MKKKMFFYFTLLLLGIVVACSDESVDDIYKGSSDMTQQLNVDWSNAADKSTDALINNFYFSTSQYFAAEIWWDLSDTAENTQEMFEQGTMNLWSQANALEVLLDAYHRTGDSKYIETAETILDKIYTINSFSYSSKVSNADTEAIGEVLLHLYDLEKDETKKAKYWDAAKTLFNEVADAAKVDPVESNQTSENEGDTEGEVAYLNGVNGIPTSALEVNQRTTATNAMGIIMATHMYHIAKNLNEVGSDNYLQLAKNVLDFCSKALYDGSGIVYDKAGVNDKGTVVLTQDKVSYSVNQGLMMGAAIAIYNITKEVDLLKYANLFATYQVKGSYTERPIWSQSYPVFMPDYKSNVLVGTLNRSVLLNRGLFFRYLLELINVSANSESNTNLYKTCLINNVESMWLHGQEDENCLWGTRWYEPPFKGEFVSTTETSDPYVSRKVIALEAQIAGSTLLEVRAALK